MNLLLIGYAVEKTTIHNFSERQLMSPAGENMNEDVAEIGKETACVGDCK